MIPADPSGTPNVLYIDGHAAPKTESGSPNEMNAMYINIIKVLNLSVTSSQAADRHEPSTYIP